MRGFGVVVLLGAGVLSASAGAPRVMAQTVPAAPPLAPDLAVTGLKLNGEFNPGGRVQLEATVTALGHFPGKSHQLEYAFQFCREKVCTGVVKGLATFTPGATTLIQTDWISVDPWVGKSFAGEVVKYTQLMVFVKDPKVQENFANNEQSVPVSAGELPKAPYAYVKFSDREIDKQNAAKLKGVSRDACLLACSADRLCKSVDYAPKTDTCYTQHVHRQQVGKAYKKSAKYDHYARPCQLDDSPKKCST